MNRCLRGLDVCIGASSGDKATDKVVMWTPLAVLGGFLVVLGGVFAFAKMGVK